MNLPDNVLEAIAKIENAGFEAYAVGGCVRDYLMGKKPCDWDLTTSAQPQDIIDIFSYTKVIPTGIKHGTLTVIIRGMQLEITTYRIDGNYADNRRPTSVTFSTKISDDLKRRDFTINAMAFSPSHGLIDLYGGTSDLQARIIRAVGEPDVRFEEDALRIMRAIRFAATLEFEIEKYTSKALFKCCPLLENIASERIVSELNKILSAKAPASTLAQYFPVIAPVLFSKDISPRLASNSFSTLNTTKPDIAVRLSLFLWCSSHIYNASAYEFGKKFFSKMKYDKYTSHQVLSCLQNIEIPLIADRIFLRKLLSTLGETLVLQLLQIKTAISDNNDELCQITQLVHTILSSDDCFRIQDLALTGSDIISYFGFKGRQVGDSLDFLLNSVMENRCDNTKEALINYLKLNPQ